ncbi:MAG: hypothetical protein FWF10_10795 [Clostridiales bacterium]|nr:hypothetical protein [Clostridiales bacterium]
MEKKQLRLWNFDFTVITLGSVISLGGNAIAGIAMGFINLQQHDSRQCRHEIMQ